MNDSDTDRIQTTTWLIAILAAGLVLQTWLFFRGWLSNDQVILLQAGLDFVKNQQLQPVAKGMSGAGHIPGGLLQLMVGIPLMIYPHFKSPNVVIGLCHVAAVLILFRVLRESMGARFMVIFLGLYWLSPWRLYHAGFLWEPSFLYLPAAAHLWACWRSRTVRSFFPSLVIGLILTATFQIHGSFLVLVVLTVILVARRLVRVHYPAFVLGFFLGGLTLIPTLLALARGELPAVNPPDGFIGRGLVYVFPLLKSVLYWIRFISLDAGGIIKRTMFFQSAWISTGVDHQVLGVAVKALYYVAVASTALCAVAAWRFFRDYWKKDKPAGGEAAAWIMQYTVMAFIAMLVSAGLSPVTIQGWHVIIIFHAACISGAYWLNQKLTDGRSALKWAIIALIVLRIPLGIVIGSGHSRYRTGALHERIRGDLMTPELIEIVPADP